MLCWFCHLDTSTWSLPVWVCTGKQSFHRLWRAHQCRTLTAVVLLDRKLCPWWARTSPCLSRPTQQPPPCTWRSRWRRQEFTARPPSRAPRPPSRSGWGQRGKTRGNEENTSTGPGESGPGTQGTQGTTGDNRFPVIWLQLCYGSISTFRFFPDPKLICLLLI